MSIGPSEPPSIDDEDEAPARVAPAGLSDEVSRFFQLDFKAVTSADRAATLHDLARKIDTWHNSRKDEGKPAPDGLVLLMPEGYGKSHLVLDLVRRGFKVVFAAKSHAQLDEKECGFRDLHGLKTHRFISKRNHFRYQLEQLGLPTNDFKFVELQPENPYAPSEVSDIATILALGEFFDKHDVPYNADEFFHEHFQMFEPADEVVAVEADVFLITFAALQAIATGERTRWWASLGLIEKTKYKDVDEIEAIYNDQPVDDDGNPRRSIHYPFKKVLIVYDDPDRSDVDWMRRVSEKLAEKLTLANARRKVGRSKKGEVVNWARDHPKYAEMLAANHRRLDEEARAIPRYKLVEFKSSTYLERPPKLNLGHGLNCGTLRPKILITTTEWLTGYYALQTLKRTGLRAATHVDLFHSADCIVTAISTTITRKRNHAVLLPIIEKLKLEFPDETVHLIADGLNCQLNLSNNKGRNDLTEATTIIKLSWPHPSVNATLGAHFSDVEDPNYDLMIATQLADLGNQAIGRNQGFRFKGKQAIVLLDPKYFKLVIERNLLRYKLTPWSSQLPSFNKKTTKRAALSAVQYADDQSPLERRLIELIANADSFGLSDEAKTLAGKLPELQRNHYEEWRSQNGSADALAARVASEAMRREKNAQKVRLYRERKKGASKS